MYMSPKKFGPPNIKHLLTPLKCMHGVNSLYANSCRASFPQRVTQQETVGARWLICIPSLFSTGCPQHDRVQSFSHILLPLNMSACRDPQSNFLRRAHEPRDDNNTSTESRMGFGMFYRCGAGLISSFLPFGSNRS